MHFRECATLTHKSFLGDPILVTKNLTTVEAGELHGGSTVMLTQTHRAVTGEFRRGDIVGSFVKSPFPYSRVTDKEPKQETLESTSNPRKPLTTESSS